MGKGSVLSLLHKPHQWCVMVSMLTLSAVKCGFEFWLLGQTKDYEICCFSTKGETIHRMYRNRDYFGDGSVHDTWRPLTIQTI